MFKKVQYAQPISIDPNALTITKTGRINLNKYYLKRCSLDKSVGVDLYWDEAGSKIAITFTKKKHPGSFPLAFIPTGQAAYIIAAQFFRSRGLDPEKCAASYEVETQRSARLGITGDSEVLVINLKKGLGVATKIDQKVDPERGKVSKL